MMKKYSYCVGVDIDNLPQLMAYMYFNDRSYGVVDVNKVQRLDNCRATFNVEIICLCEMDLDILLRNTKAIRVW